MPPLIVVVVAIVTQINDYKNGRCQKTRNAAANLHFSRLGTMLPFTCVRVCVCDYVKHVEMFVNICVSHIDKLIRGERVCYGPDRSVYLELLQSYA